MRATRLTAFFALALAAVGCNKKDDFTSEPLSDYLPLVAGKSITYRLDSTVYTNFGRNTEVHSYQEKQVVDAQVTDNLNRPSYRIFRYLRDTAGTQPWKPAGSYLITPNGKTMEVIENNLRFVRLSGPIRQDFTWKGNHYLGTDPYRPIYDFNNDNDIQNWEQRYDQLGETVTLKGKTYTDVITVEGIDEAFNNPATDPGSYAYRNRQQEKYSKGVGLIEQTLIMWEYQPNTNGQGGGYRIGFGVKRTILDRN